jgi:hypothetical protein
MSGLDGLLPHSFLFLFSPVDEVAQLNKDVEIYLHPDVTISAMFMFSYFFN